MKQTDGYILEKIEDITYILPYGQNIADRKKAVRVNEMGEFLWEVMAHDVTREQIYNEVLLSMKYDGADDEDSIKEDIDCFLDKLLKCGVIRENSTCNTQILWNHIEIGNLLIRMEGKAEVFSHEFEKFIVNPPEDKEPDMIIKVHISNPFFNDNGCILVRNEEMCICECEDEYIILFPKMEQVKQAVIKKDGSLADYYCGFSQADDLRNELFHAIRHAYVYKAQQKNIYAMHSASLLYKEKIWLFSGPSGTGKSTHTKLWKDNLGVELINGDLNLIALEKEKAIVYGLPWCGTSGISKKCRYELGGIILLEQYPVNIVENLPAHRKVIGVMNRFISPSWKKEQMLSNVNFARKLTDKIYIGKLKCTKDIEALQIVKNKIDSLQ